MIAEGVITQTEARPFLQGVEPYLCKPDMILLLTAQHSVASARINNRSSNSGTLTPVARKTIESKEFFRRREKACRELSMKLAPLLELDTKNLSINEMCNSASSLLARSLFNSAATGEGEQR
jgi:thymidylate kinase